MNKFEFWRFCAPSNGAEEDRLSLPYYDGERLYSTDGFRMHYKRVGEVPCFKPGWMKPTRRRVRKAEWCKEHTLTHAKHEATPSDFSSALTTETVDSMPLHSTNRVIEKVDSLSRYWDLNRLDQIDFNALSIGFTEEGLISGAHALMDYDPKLVYVAGDFLADALRFVSGVPTLVHGTGGLYHLDMKGVKAYPHPDTIPKLHLVGPSGEAVICGRRCL